LAPSRVVKTGILALRKASPTGTTPSIVKEKLTLYSFPSRSLGNTNHSSVCGDVKGSELNFPVLDNIPLLKNFGQDFETKIMKR
jgi:hypothetical protein